MKRVVHYLNQFFAGLGGEDAAGSPPGVKPGAVGPGRKLQELLGSDIQIVATVYCGDDYAAAQPNAASEIMALIRQEQPDLVLAGPAFTSGRYGVAVARVIGAAHRAGIPTVGSLHPDNPGLDDAGAATVIASGANVREMGPSLDRLAAAARSRLSGEPVETVGKVPRKNVLAAKRAAARAIDLVLARLAGNKDRSEVPVPRFDRITPAPPVTDVSKARVALLTEAGLVPNGNPGRLESARATRWLRYTITGRGSLGAGGYMSVHGGFSTVAANQDPNRLLPLDVARELERDGAVGELFGEYFVTTGNGTTVPNARRFGVEWAAELRRAGVQAVILTAT